MLNLTLNIVSWLEATFYLQSVLSRLVLRLIRSLLLVTIELARGLSI